MPRTSSVSTEQSQSGADRILEMQVKADPKAFARCLQEFQIKQEDLKSLVDMPRLPHASGNREAFTDDDRWKANWWTTSWWEK